MTGGRVRVLSLRVRQLEHEIAIAERLACFDDGGPTRERVYRFIALEADNFPVTTLCRVCRASRSAYYAWSERTKAGPDGDLVAEAHLANQIHDLWTRSRRRYGAPRLRAALARAGTAVAASTMAPTYDDRPYLARYAASTALSSASRASANVTSRSSFPARTRPRWERAAARNQRPAGPREERT